MIKTNYLYSLGLDQFVIIPRSDENSTEVKYFEPRVAKILSGMSITWMNRYKNSQVNIDLYIP